MNRHYAVSDLHGMYGLWQQISDYCDESDVVYFLGDATDRGSEGIKLMQTLLNDKRVRYIRGNHEQMLLDAIVEKDHWNFSLLKQNGGSKTYEDFITLSREDQDKLLLKINSLPYMLLYINKNHQTIYLNHSGFLCPLDILGWEERTQDYLWNRKHFHEEWFLGDNEFIVHGHTPVPYVIYEIDPTGAIYGEDIEADEVFKYCNGHKIDLDITSFATNKVALFDLDKLEVEKYFSTERS